MCEHSSHCDTDLSCVSTAVIVTQTLPAPEIGGSTEAVEFDGLSCRGGSQELYCIPLSSGPIPVMTAAQFGALQVGIWHRPRRVVEPSVKKEAILGRKEVAFSRYRLPSRVEEGNY